MIVSVFGITIDCKLVQWANAESPIEMTPLGKFIDFKLEQPLNAKQLMAEGRYMGHCVASYKRSCQTGNTSICLRRTKQ